MHIIQINASYKPAYIYGGPTMSVSKLTEQLVQNGINTEVFTTTANGATELNIKPGSRTMVDGVSVTYFRRITKGNSHLSISLLFSLWEVLRKNRLSVKPTIIHIHAWWNLVSVGSTIVALALSKYVILSPRGTLSNYSFNNRNSTIKNIFHRVIGKALLRQFHFHVSTEKEKQDILKIIQPKSITIIPNFVNLGSVPNPLKTENCQQNTETLLPFKLLFLSRIEEKKGLDILFRALRNLNISYHLTIAGTGKADYINWLKALATQFNLTSKITWIGQQDNDEKFTVLAAHDLMVLPSHDESFANVVIESLSVGTPVLVSSKVGLVDYVKANNFGWVCENTPAYLAETLELALKDKEKRKMISSKASQQIASDFDDQHLIAQYLQLYKNIAKHV